LQNLSFDHRKINNELFSVKVKKEVIFLLKKGLYSRMVKQLNGQDFQNTSRSSYYRQSNHKKSVQKK
jgi:hypothetical protein